MKKAVSVLLVLALLISAVLFAIPVSAAEGTAIDNEWDFREMKQGGKYYLTEDLTISSDSNTAVYMKDFSGTLDGNGHTITFSTPHSAIFWRVTGTVKNLTVAGDLTLTSNTKVAGLCLYNQGTIENVTSKVVISGSGYAEQTDPIGGICAEVDGGYAPTFKNCVFEGSITFNTTTTATDKRVDIGGIVGKACSPATKIILDNCVNKGNITSNQAYSQIGGVIGYFGYMNLEMDGCVNEGNLTTNGSPSHMGFGGLIGCGHNSGNSDKKATIKNSHNKGKLTTEIEGYNGSNLHCGGIIGRVYAMPHLLVENCNNSGDILTGNASGWSATGGIVGNLMTVSPSMSWSNLEKATYTVRNCSNSGTISGLETGGIIGAGMQLATKDVSIKIEGCLNEGTVYGTGSTGGIIGLTTRYDGAENFGNFTAKGCMNAGYVNGRGSAGGIVGEQGGSLVDSNIITLIDSCVNIGEVKSSFIGEKAEKSYAAGILGNTARNTTISNCVNLGKLVGPNMNVNNITPIVAVPVSGVVITASGNFCIDDCNAAQSYSTEKASLAEILSVVSGDIPAIDESELTAAFDSVKSLKGSDYTEKSWKTLVNACDFASSLYEDNIIVTQSQISVAAMAITAAKAALKKYVPQENTNGDANVNEDNNNDDANINEGEDNTQNNDEINATEPVESETVKDTTNETTADNKTGETEKKEKKGGCASSITGAAVALTSVLALGAGFVFKKKDTDLS